MTDREFAALPLELVRRKAVLPVLCDWLGIDDWPSSGLDDHGLNAWRSAAPSMTRVSIVHGRRFNRQAAWLAAILRTEGVVVRSWRPQDATPATLWLTSPM